MNQQQSEKPIESEAKWHLDNVEKFYVIKGLLQKFTAKYVETRNENNLIFDKSAEGSYLLDIVLRLRYINQDTKAVLTLKCNTKIQNGIKNRIEFETGVDDGKITESILEGLGFHIVTAYSKTRESWEIEDTEILLDILPFGYYCEIEGSPSNIEKYSKVLGLDLRMCEKRDYTTLMKEHERNTSRNSGEKTNTS